MNDNTKGTTVIFQSLEASRRLEMARKMLRYKFTTSVIEVETSVGAKTLRKLRDEMNISREERIRGNRQFRSITTIINNASDRKIASTFLYTYVAICGQEKGKVDIDLFVKAYYMFYQMIQRQNKLSGKQARIPNISEAYSLAAAYRSREVSLEVCSSCGTPYAVFFEAPSTGCPNAVNRIGMHGNVMDQRMPFWPGMKKRIYSNQASNP